MGVPAYCLSSGMNYNYKQYVSGILRRDGFAFQKRRIINGELLPVSESRFRRFIRDLSTSTNYHAGYGSIGNQNIPPYSYYDRYGLQYYYTFGGTMTMAMP